MTRSRACASGEWSVTAEFSGAMLQLPSLSLALRQSMLNADVEPGTPRTAVRTALIIRDSTGPGRVNLRKIRVIRVH